MSVTIKFEKTINTCLHCPFSAEYTRGSSCSKNGEYFELECTKLDRVIDSYDREEYIKDNFTVEIPKDCPYHESR